MGISSYDSDADLNISLGGIQVDHGLIPWETAYHIRAIMADIDADLGATSNPTFNNITVTGTVDGHDIADELAILNGVALDGPVIDVTSNGTTITLGLEKSGTGDIRFLFSDGIYTHDCTPADTVALTAGSDTSPQINYIYLLQSDKTLTASTTGFPSAEYAPIATVMCQSAASAQTDGAYKVHAWTDHITDSNLNGHIAHLNYWIRQQNATWVSGAVCTPTGGSSNFDIAVSSGSVLQLRAHAFAAVDTATGDPIFVINNSATPYNRVTDLSGETNDATGTALKAWYSVVIWGVVNEDAPDCKLMCNLPTGSYPNNSGGRATNDDDKYSVYAIPADYTGTGFLIARVTVSKSGSTFTIEETEDLRGQGPSSAAGSSGISQTEFADNVFRIQDEGDTTKEMAFQLSGVSTGTTMTITMPDNDLDLGTPEFSGLTVDTNTLVVDSTNNRVGVGTASPSGVLHVAQAGNVKQTLESTDSGSAIFRLATDSTSRKIVARDGADTVTKTQIEFGDTTVKLGGASISSNLWVTASVNNLANNGVDWRVGSGSPEGVETAVVGSIFSRTDGGAGTTLYVKESGTGNTGWVAK